MKMNFAKKATALAMSVLFAVSMAGCGSSASTAKKVEVTSVEDLADLKIGVQTGTTGDSQASDAGSAVGITTQKCKFSFFWRQQQMYLFQS